MQSLFAAPREISFLHVSPAGGHIVYVSDETGTPEIYVRPLPGPGGAVRVSAAGGTPHSGDRTGRRSSTSLQTGRP